MKKILPVTFLALTLTLGAGCVTASRPAPTPNNPAPAEVYSVSPAVSNASAQFHTAWSAAAPVLSLTPAAPAAPFVPPIVDGVFALLTLASGAFAAYKNAQAKAHSNAAAALAATVMSAQGGDVAAMKHATFNGSSTCVAEHLDRAANPVQL